MARKRKERKEQKEQIYESLASTVAAFKEDLEAIQAGLDGPAGPAIEDLKLRYQGLMDSLNEYAARPDADASDPEFKSRAAAAKQAEKDLKTAEKDAKHAALTDDPWSTGTPAAGAEAEAEADSIIDGAGGYKYRVMDGPQGIYFEIVGDRKGKYSETKPLTVKPGTRGFTAIHNELRAGGHLGDVEALPSEPAAPKADAPAAEEPAEEPGTRSRTSNISDLVTRPPKEGVVYREEYHPERGEKRPKNWDSLTAATQKMEKEAQDAAEKAALDNPEWRF